MPKTKKDLEKEIKELKAEIRDLRKAVPMEADKVELDLPLTGIAVVKEGLLPHQLEVGVNLETNEIAILGKKPLRKDVAISFGLLQKDIFALLREIKR